MKILKLTFVCLLMTTFCFSQSPDGFNYQGVARDTDGNPMADRDITIQLSILSSSSSGNLEYSETHSVTTSSLGLFSLKAGSGSPMTGQFEDIDWGGTNHFLEVAIDENAGTNFTVLGTSELLSVPYALHANSGGEWSESTNGIIYEDGNVQIGEDNGNNFSAVPTLNIFGDDTPNNFILRVEQGGDGLNKGVFWGSPGSTSSGRIYLDNDVFTIGRSNNVENRILFNLATNGNIGINETEPRSKIHLKSGDIYLEDIDSGVIMKSPNGNCWRISVNNDGTMSTTSISCP